MELSFRGFRLLFLTFIIPGFLSCNQNDYVTIDFDSKMEASGKKFSLADISPDLPKD